MSEELSESEIRLHLQLAEAALRGGDRRAGLSTRP
jgi:hypothetical protein